MYKFMIAPAADLLWIKHGQQCLVSGQNIGPLFLDFFQTVLLRHWVKGSTIWMPDARLVTQTSNLLIDQLQQGPCTAQNSAHPLYRGLAVTLAQLDLNERAAYQAMLARQTFQTA